MGDTIDDYKSIKDKKKALRIKYGAECPLCKQQRPKTSATILIPQQRCKVDGYLDQRKELTAEQWKNA